MRGIKDIDNTIKEMDKQYDANFGDWVRSEENLDVLSVNLKKYVYKYDQELFTAVISWITNDWAFNSKVKLIYKVFRDGLFHTNSPEDIQNSKDSIFIIKKIIKNWSVLQVSELIIEFITEMEKEEKKLFLLWVLDEVPHDRLTEIFIRIDNSVDWALKITIIKHNKMGNMQNK
ncbi:hypothetical protein NEAUS04_2407 [Nematocida ausubeli]|uniref:Uncharacterized protein n=1 Tax=Nematocida ausubeli (strain ATCC PRA-371 / ERTm2) TaxID=1913371 RepID=H8ZD13_NEMA1|nr:uncharacterized protein NESG_02001 [Nematocida ausubeli]EHY65553.1 hypothetical protein NERG_01160 [Nematocida ausubeli]KAI5136263.1 hypothetical protein NEAUS07_1550 [Nematocida ausubeli]KAI5138725.1 hypothetical protein NEAUS06_2522 [Nematocida ausubeli]KAI5146974.1 hypothetical protein NEAUS05_0310 [Nematocida ausubeli]KAI5163533.1 hypothetical protein NEAUS04_1639 [Nematocida ausubeli]